MSNRMLFDECAALAKVGHRIKTLVEFSGVPRGTLGEVTRADRSGAGYTVAIQWELSERIGKPLIDWFTRDEYERFLRSCNRRYSEAAASGPVSAIDRAFLRDQYDTLTRRGSR